MSPLFANKEKISITLDSKLTLSSSDLEDSIKINNSTCVSKQQGV